MALAQRVVGLGRAARESAGLKLRQPLARPSSACRAGRRRGAGSGCAHEIMEELNVKELRTVTPAASWSMC